jgi:hypothetical protein
MSPLNEVFEILMSSSISPVKPLNVKPDRQYFVVLHGFDQEIEFPDERVLGRNLYKMSGSNVRRLIVNIMLFDDNTLNSDNTELRRMTDDDIIADYTEGFGSSLTPSRINVTVYDVSSIFRVLTLGKEN